MVLNSAQVMNGFLPPALAEFYQKANISRGVPIHFNTSVEGIGLDSGKKV